MSFETITLDTDRRGIARLVLNRPEKHNALNARMIGDLAEAARQLAADPAIRVVILSANGKSFCAGGDLGWMRDQFEADHAARLAEATKLASMLRLLDELPKLLIGSVEGKVFGGGLGLISVCDIVLSTPDAKFALTETRLGLVPATIAPFVLSRIGLSNARRFALNANPFTAAQAHAMGLVSEIHEPGTLAAAVDHQILLALACAPGAIADAKRLFRDLAIGALHATATPDILAARWETGEARLGIEAFFNRTRPPWAK